MMRAGSGVVAFARRVPTLLQPHQLARIASALVAAVAVAAGTQTAGATPFQQADLNSVYGSLPALQEIALDQTDIGSGVVAYELAPPEVWTSESALSCWSGPNGTPDEASVANMLSIKPPGTDFMVFLLRGTRAYAADIAAGDYCWIDLPPM